MKKQTTVHPDGVKRISDLLDRYIRLAPRDELVPLRRALTARLADVNAKILTHAGRGGTY